MLINGLGPFLCLIEDTNLCNQIKIKFGVMLNFRPMFYYGAQVTKL